MRRLEPDKRLNWRDPNMPVERDYKFPNGSQPRFIDPDYERRYREHRMNNAMTNHWSIDPTYNLRRKR